MGTWLETTDEMVAPTRWTMKRWAAGSIIRSCSVSRYHDGSAFHGGSLNGCSPKKLEVAMGFCTEASTRARDEDAAT